MASLPIDPIADIFARPKTCNKTSCSTFNMSTTDPVHLRLHQHKAYQPCDPHTQRRNHCLTRRLSWQHHRLEIQTCDEHHLGLWRKMSHAHALFFFPFFVGYTQPKNRWMSCTHQYPKGTFKRVKFLEKQIPQKATHHRNLQYGKYPKYLCLTKNCSKHLQSISSVSTLNFQRRTQGQAWFLSKSHDSQIPTEMTTFY